MSTLASDKKAVLMPLSDLLTFLEQDLQDVLTLALDPGSVREHLVSLKNLMDSDPTFDFLKDRGTRASDLAQALSVSVAKALDIIRPGGCIGESCLIELSRHLGDIVEKIPLLMSTRRCV